MHTMHGVSGAMHGNDTNTRKTIHKINVIVLLILYHEMIYIIKVCGQVMFRSKKMKYHKH